MFRQRRVENAANFPCLEQAVVKKTTLYIREDGPDAWGGRIDLPDHCWYCWENGDTWFHVHSRSHIWITQKQAGNVFVLHRDSDGVLYCEHYVVRDIDQDA